MRESLTMRCAMCEGDCWGRKRTIRKRHPQSYQGLSEIFCLAKTCNSNRRCPPELSSLFQCCQKRALSFEAANGLRNSDTGPASTVALRATSALQAILARGMCEGSRHGKGMPRSQRRCVSGVHRPCESGFARCRGQGFTDSWRVQGNANCHALGVPESNVSIPSTAQR